MFRLWSQHAVARYSGPASDIEGRAIPMPAASRADSDRILEFWLRARQWGWGFRWALLIEAPDTGDADARLDWFAGHIGYNAVGQDAEIAYHLDPAHWGNGYMSEAMALALAWAFDHPVPALRSELVAAYIEPENAPSVALVERFGFTGTADVTDGARRYELSRGVWRNAQVE